MEIIDDSGIDSDQKLSMNEDVHIKQPGKNGSSTTSPGLAKMRRGSELQKKIQKQRDASRRGFDPQTKKTVNIVSRSRLIVPSTKGHTPLRADEQPLVLIASDDSEEDDHPMFSQLRSGEIARQLIKDGYNLNVDEEGDELDLIPPKPIRRCVCCNVEQMCTIQ